MSKTPPPTDQRADFLDLTTDPYTALGLRMTTYPLPDSDHMEAVSLALTVAIDPLLRNVPVLRTAQIYKLSYTQIFQQPARVYIDGEGDVDPAAVEPSKRPFSAYLVDQATADKVLEHYGTNRHALRDFQNTVLGCLNVADDSLYYPDVAENSGHRLLVQAFDIPATGANFSSLELYATQPEQPAYVCVKSLMTVAAVYELASRRGSKMPPLPNNKASIFVQNDAPHYCVYNGALGSYTGLIKPEGRQQDAAHRLMRHVRNSVELREEAGRQVTTLSAMVASTRDLLEKTREAVRAELTGAPDDAAPELAAFIAQLRKFQEVEPILQAEYKSAAVAWFELANQYARQAGSIIEAGQKLPSVIGRIEVLNERHREIKDRSTRIYSNLLNLYPFMSVVPAGGRFDLSQDMAGKKILVQRVAGKDEREYTQLALPLDHPERHMVVQLSQSISKYPGLMAQGFVAVHKHYQDKGGLNGERPVMVDMTLADLAKIMRPNAQHDKGLSAVFKAKGFNPREFFGDLMTLLKYMHLEVPNAKAESDHITELFHVARVTQGHRADDIAVKIMLNEEVHKAMTTGTSEGVRYMMTNVEAMMSYNSAQLGHAPSVQLTLENLIRINAYKGPNQGQAGETILVPDMSVRQLAYRFGFIPGAPATLTRNVENYLDVMKEHGILTRWRYAGSKPKEKLDWHIEMESGKGYGVIRQLMDLEDEQRRIEAFLADPLRAKKPVSAVENSDKDKPAAPQRRRGRPKKSGT
jgi:hypothetical protein